MKKINLNHQAQKVLILNPRILVYVTIPVLLGACTLFTQPSSPDSMVLPKWLSSLTAAPNDIKPISNPTSTTPTLIPHKGSLADLNQWWASLKDPVLLELIADAQKLSPTLALAKTRIEQARAQQTISQAAGVPNLSGNLGISRGRTDPTYPVANMLSGSLQASWELDLWGSLSLGKDAANKRVQGSQAAWHEARVSVAAEVATVYYNLLNCERMASSNAQQVQSLKETQKLNDLLVKNGFMSTVQSSYSVLALSQSETNLAQVNAQCRSLHSALYALTGLDEAKLKKLSSVANTTEFFPASVMMPVVPTVPAQLLSQRPDVWAAENEVAAASAEVGQAQRQFLPRLGLSGSVTAIRANSADVTTNLKTWSIGPLAFTLPIFEGGKIAAQEKIANAQYDQAVVVYQAKVRQAVQETQDALSLLQATDEQSQSAQAAFKAASQILRSSELQLKQGMLSGLQMEEAKRQMLSAKMGLHIAELNRMNAWISLYRVLGGGWESKSNS